MRDSKWYVYTSMDIIDFTGGMVYFVLCWAYSIKMGKYRQDFRINLWKALLFIKDKVHSRINGDTKLIRTNDEN